MSNIENTISQLDLDENLKTTFFDELESWYNHERQRTINIKKYIPYIVYFIFAIPACIMFYACLLGGFWDVLIFLLILSAFILFEILIRYFHRISVDKYFESIELTYRKINKDDFPDLESTLNILLNNVSMGNYKVKMFFDRNNHYVPAVCERNIDKQENYIYFLLSRNLLLLHKANNNLFESIIYHELGHIYQHDTNLWVERNLMKKRNKITLIVYLTSIPLIIYRLMSNSNAKKFYKIERRQAEFYADLYSIINSKDFGIVRFLEGNYLSDSEDIDHPAPNERIGKIEKIVYKIFNKISIG